MADVWVVLSVLGFFGLCVAFVYGCDRIIGPDDSAEFELSPQPEDLVAEVTR